MIRKTSLFALASTVALLLCAPLAHAIPALQLYSPDAVYDMSTETWTISDDTFELWVVGAVGDYGTIY
ncbi:MAG TPA: choice-of-anchor N protein, partial [Candidatus Eisenbacteria bacterium]